MIILRGNRKVHFMIEGVCESIEAKRRKGKQYEGRRNSMYEFVRLTVERKHDSSVVATLSSLRLLFDDRGGSSNL